MVTHTMEKFPLKGTSALGADARQIRRLDSANSYLSEILKPQFAEFFAEPATLRSAFNLANALFHFHEWLFASHQVELAKQFGVTKPSGFSNCVCFLRNFSLR